jgi:GNAT superfamily N-acetyltransferase
VKVCQAFASADEAAGMAPLERHGFRHTTQLVLLRRDLALTALPPEPRTPLSYRPEAPPLGAEFRRVLLATHEGTLDCPELTGPRTAEELLAGFDEPTPGGGWNLACDGAEPVGVVIHAAGAEPEAADLTYFGVVPPHRGRGVGGDLLAHSLRAFHSAGVRLLTVSVDARNGPAMKLYARHGFAEYDRREVWLATLG